MNKIIEVKFGSHLYGTATPNSDLDFKGIYLPTAREIILNKAKYNISTTRSKREFEKNTKDDVDIEIFSLKEYLKLLAEGQTVALDMLFAPDAFQIFKGARYDIFKTIYDNKDKLLSRGILSFIGYAQKQASKYGIKGSRIHSVKHTIEYLSSFKEDMLLKELKSSLDLFVAEGDEHIGWAEGVDQHDAVIQYFQVCNRKFQMNNSVKYTKNVLSKVYDEYGYRAKLAETNEGIDWKALSHAVRVNFEGQELLRTGHITFPCIEAPLLLSIKTGQVKYDEVAKLIETGLKELETLQKTSFLAAEPDLTWIENFVYDVYSDIVKKGE